MRLVGDVTRHLLFASFKGDYAPIQKKALSAIVSAKYKKIPGLLDLVLYRAQRYVV